MNKNRLKNEGKEQSVGTIFVTVGNGKFDPLVEELDRLKREGVVKQNIVIQLGHGNYKPKHCQWFTFDPELNKYYSTAEIVICHGGPGTVFEILRLGKKLIALPNRDRTDPRHQVEYLEAMAKETRALLYCETVELLAETLRKAEAHQFTSYQQPICTMHEAVSQFLQ